MTISGFLKDIAFALVIVAVIIGALCVYAGTWPPIVDVTSGSMEPHLEKGDLVFIQGLDSGSIKTYEGNESIGYFSFGETGDVIVYRPGGNGTPIIHRVIRYVTEGAPMWYGGPPAPYSGYITLGDANDGECDQMTDISYGQPVKPEWIVGIARYRIPYLGYLRMVLPF